MDHEVLRESIKLAFGLPDNCPNLMALAKQLDLLLKADETGQDTKSALQSFFDACEKAAA